jgi:hypothetical protein
MQVLNDAAIDNRHRLAFGKGRVERRDLTGRKVNFSVTWGKGSVGDIQLGGVDKGLAIKTQIAALLAFGAQAVVILEGIEHAVDDDQTLRACRQQAQTKPCLHCQSVRPKAAV